MERLRITLPSKIRTSAALGWLIGPVRFAHKHSVMDPGRFKGLKVGK